MVVFKGAGFLALLIPLLCAVLVELSVDALFGAGFYKSAPWPLPLALMISALLVLLVGKNLHAKPSRTLIDQETGEKVEMKERHTMFWIPLEVWAIIIAAVSVWVYLANSGVIFR